MEDNFRVRVEKAFGSLSSSSLNSPWYLSDEEIERREWNRGREVSSDADDDDAKPDDGVDFFAGTQPEAQLSNQNFSRRLLSDLGELDDGGKHTRRRKRGDRDGNGDGGFCSELERRKDENDEDWDIRSTIGLDCTLDYEEEEDQHDRFAVGREGAGDRLYMRDMLVCGAGAELPGAQNEFNHDPRADHMAAKLRLREDAEAAGDFDSLNLADTSMTSSLLTQSNELETGVNPKPILKKKEISTDTRSAKRVRFEEPFLGTKVEDAAESCQVEDAAEIEEADNVLGDQLTKSKAKTIDGANTRSTSIDDVAIDKTSFPTEITSHALDYVRNLEVSAEVTFRVPDYVRNPSKYTRYSLDSSDDMDEESNKKAYMDFLNLPKKPIATELEVDKTSASPPKSLIFTPKKKAHSSTLVKEENMFEQNQAEMHKDKALPVSIAVGDSRDEVSAMEEDGQGIDADKILSMQKPGRQYRSRTDTDNDDHVT